LMSQEGNLIYVLGIGLRRNRLGILPTQYRYTHTKLETADTATCLPCPAQAGGLT